MKIRFRGVGDANHIGLALEHPTCPQVGDIVRFDSEEDEWSVRTVIHTPVGDEYDVYVVVGPRQPFVSRLVPPRGI